MNGDIFLSLLTVSAILLVSCRGEKGCHTCCEFVRAFEKGLKSTEGSNFAGGDTSWEEENNLKYSRSEVRLVEVLENVCDRSDYKCIKFLEENEEEVERWWFKIRHKDQPDMKQWLCFSHLDICCPDNTYGPDCRDCPGGRDLPCNGHGTCQGSSEKDGSGVCSCDTGYEGEQCTSCRDGYYNDSSICSECDTACKKSCSGAGPEQCAECASGYRRDEPENEPEQDGEKPALPCLDIDECEEDIAQCSKGTYCSNTAGSYQCSACNSACLHSCSGPGSNDCDECASGYENNTGYCMDIDECKVGEASCSDGTYCLNTAGSYKCEGCDESCKLKCSGAGPAGCEECANGYKMEDGSCEDIDECEWDLHLCDNATEVCVNKKGSHSCSCRQGYIKQKGECQPKELAGMKKSKKKKKKRKAAVEVPADEPSPQQSSDSQAAPPTDSSSPAHEEL